MRNIGDGILTRQVEWRIEDENEKEEEEEEGLRNICGENSYPVSDLGTHTYLDFRVVVRVKKVPTLYLQKKQVFKPRHH